MRTLEEDLLKMDSLHGDELDAHLYEMKAWYVKPEEKEMIRRHLDKTLDTIADNVESIGNRLTIREQMDEIIDLIPVSYIAKNYFGKSRAWLYQRINGYKIRGRVYTLNEKELEIFNRALKDIGNKIGSLSVG
ncbi:DUF5053 domain-containing protein [Bacteroides salyersiae]|jgi:hypothetical protein|uniref:DUF5053 domain-containing protein n=1 Tax=Bacteroides salyersiae TaxID=291644 RepID=UPI001C8C6915|nr:DUF5053 domain-containing protein [Bacteroides salyersiae]